MGVCEEWEANCHDECVEYEHHEVSVFCVCVCICVVRACRGVYVCARSPIWVQRQRQCTRAPFGEHADGYTLVVWVRCPRVQPLLTPHSLALGVCDVHSMSRPHTHTHRDVDIYSLSFSPLPRIPRPHTHTHPHAAQVEYCETWTPYTFWIKELKVVVVHGTTHSLT